jgi:hypothetical protein
MEGARERPHSVIAPAGGAAAQDHHQVDEGDVRLVEVAAHRDQDGQGLFGADFAVLHSA